MPMQIIVYTNLESWQRNGILPTYGLSYMFQYPEPIKGIGINKVEPEVNLPEEAAQLEFLLCHQGREKNDVMALIRPEEEIYLVLHNTDLRGLYTRISIQLAPAKVFYLYETSEKGATVDLLQTIAPYQKARDTVAYYGAIDEYLKAFKARSIRLFKKELINDPFFLDYQSHFEYSSCNQALPYLWKHLLVTHPSLKNALQAFFATNAEEEKLQIRIKIHELLMES